MNCKVGNGLEDVLRSAFSVQEPDGKARLEFVSYSIGEPKYDPEESVRRGVHYAAPLKVMLRLIIWNTQDDQEIKGIKEQEVFLADVPLMTKDGTFIINGAQRVVVSQLHRSPGVFYTKDGKNFAARVVPYRGSWLDIEFDTRDVLYFRIDRKRKMYLTTLLRAYGMSTQDILSTFYKPQECTLSNQMAYMTFLPEGFKGMKVPYDVILYQEQKVIIKKGERLTSRKVDDIKRHYQNQRLVYVFPIEETVGLILHQNLFSVSGEIIAKAGSPIDKDLINVLLERNVNTVQIVHINHVNAGPFIRDTLIADKNDTSLAAMNEIYRVIRPGNNPTNDKSVESFFQSIFMDKEKYDLSLVGRMKLNQRHGNDHIASTLLLKQDIIVIIQNILLFKMGIGEIDDIDDLSNRRVRASGELVENVFRTGLNKMPKSIIERMSIVDIDTAMPHDLVHSKNLVNAIREFFGLSQLSQFMDQINPLASITHKRRLSALGPGGLTRDRAGFEVRDVHVSHYSRICPIETPEGGNIGLISSMAIYADIDKYGFIQSPYRKVQDGKITNEIVNLTSAAEEGYNIVNATVPTNDGVIIDKMVLCHRKGELVQVPRESVKYADVSPQQLVSVAASLIPFLENNDANRALMGSNMMRQATPLIRHESPLVGTGMEAVVARNSGTVITADDDGIVDSVDAEKIVIRSSDKKIPVVQTYKLSKFGKSNQGTCINQKPIVDVGEKISQGDVIADGVSTDRGELALGRNVLTAFLPWNGYNFEDSILLSERLVQSDHFTSIHIKEYEVLARDTRLGPEEITRDIPNMSDQALKNLDEVGIVNIGVSVKAGDILVGKVMPQSESPLTAEEKLLRAIFGEKSSDVKNYSLRMPPGEEGTVVSVKILTKRGIQKDQRALSIEKIEIAKLIKEKQDKISLIEKQLLQLIKTVIASSSCTIKHYKDFCSINVEKLNISQEHIKYLLEIRKFYNDYTQDLNQSFAKKIEKLQSGDDLQQGILKSVKVFVASKIKIQPGDKMAGRHGNKGIVSRIVPIEEMPYLEDGTPIDMVLNPSGVPSRMNIGQILEIHLGWAARELGQQVRKFIEQKDHNSFISHINNILPRQCLNKEKIQSFMSSMSDTDMTATLKDCVGGIHFATPVFDGAKEEDIDELLIKSKLDKSGQVLLRDGKTGEFFDRKVTVGIMYMLKLDHLVDSKIHARSVGPYSLVTQQPLGGRSHFGGQRFGEMECWALQAYGASYTLREMLTIKSDDVAGRVRAYEAIIRGDNFYDTSLPESFKVMIKEIRSLGLNLEMLE